MNLTDLVYGKKIKILNIHKFFSSTFNSRSHCSYLHHNFVIYYLFVSTNLWSSASNESEMKIWILFMCA